MKKPLVLKLLMLVGLIGLICQNAQAGLFDNIASQVTQSVTNASNKQQNNSQAAQQQATQQQAGQQQAASGVTNSAPTSSAQTAASQGADTANLVNVDLDKGGFGVPLKSGVQDVAKWCVDNNVTVSNTTKQQAEDNARKILNRVKEIRSSYDTEKADLSQMQQDLLKETTDPSIDEIEKEAIEQAQKTLDVLKNPTFDYQGNTYYLQPLFGDGLQVPIGGISKVCNDSRITQTMYALTVVPSEKSEKLLNNLVQSIQIYFRRDASGNLVSYATLASISNDDTSVFNKQYDTMTKILNDKYGASVSLTALGPGRVDVDRTGRGITQGIPEDNTPEGIVYRLTEGSYQGEEALFWRKNIMLITAGSNLMNLIYYAPGAANEILGSYKQAIQDFEVKSSKEEENKEGQMKQDF